MRHTPSTRPRNRKHDPVYAEKTRLASNAVNLTPQLGDAVIMQVRVC